VACLALLGSYLQVHRLAGISGHGSFGTGVAWRVPSSSYPDGGAGRNSNRAEWLVNLASALLGASDGTRRTRKNKTGGGGGGGSGGPVNLDEERVRVAALSRQRAESRRRRTRPPTALPTALHSAASAASGGPPALVVDSPGGGDPPGLVLDLPAHRALRPDVPPPAEEDGKKKNPGSGAEWFPSETFGDLVRRRLRGNHPLCGPSALEANGRHPSDFPARWHVGPDSRVVVTGALSQLGMELILQLHELCGVGSLVAVDDMYPNTRRSRIDAVEGRLKYLQRRVPGFEGVVLPTFGVHPHPFAGDELKHERMNQSFDVVERFRPTHVVHLGGGEEEGRGEHADYGDTDGASPFVDGGESGMMRRFTRSLGMEQVLQSLARDNEGRDDGGAGQPRLVYVSSNEVDDLSGVPLAPLTPSSAAASSDGSKLGSGGTPATTRQRQPPASVLGSSSLAAELLASYYHRRHGVQSVGLRLPAVIGPFGRPGSLIHDLAERTVRHAAGRNVDGVPRYHLDRDRFVLDEMWRRRKGAEEGEMEQIVYVGDVAQAVLAAMQYGPPAGDGDGPASDAGPTLLRIGSKFTSSMRDLAESMERMLPAHDQSDALGGPESSSDSGPSSAAVRAVATNAAHVHGISPRDAERNRDLLGWAHYTQLGEGTKSTLAWHVLNAYPYGLPGGVPSRDAFQSLLYETADTLSFMNLPCASGCRWQGMCSPSPWDAVATVTRDMTRTCQFVIYTVDLRPELAHMDKQSSPSNRAGWEEMFCKIAFVSSSSKLARNLYPTAVSLEDSNGSRKDGSWSVVVAEGSQSSMPEEVRVMPKMTPTLLFDDRVEKAIYVNHRRVILTTDQAMGVMMHLEMKARKTRETKAVKDDDKNVIEVKLQPRAQRHSVFFTNRYSFPGGADHNSKARNLGRFVMQGLGVPETKDVKAQVQFYEQAAHLTRINMQRSPNYQEFFQDNWFPLDFIRTTWLVHELRSEAGRNLRCEFYEEQALWGNPNMEDLSIGYVLARKKVRSELGRMAEPQYEGPEEWHPLLVPRDPDDDAAGGAPSEGPLFLEYLEDAQRVATDSKGAELHVTFLRQKNKEKK